MTAFPPDGLIGALHSGGPDPARAAELELFGRFVGAWDLAWSARDADGRLLTARGELHFGWVLGGRAVQDVWIVPAPGEPGAGEPPHAFHGSTIRFYDPAIAAWRSTWIEPVNGRVRRFIGRPEGDDIVLLSDEDSPQFRWRFSEIGGDAFRWSAESSHDGGATWTPDDEMRATRRPGSGTTPA